jgi:undecaprenyl-diphosphatase
MNKSHIAPFLKSMRSYLAARDLSILLVLLIMIAGSWGFIEIADAFLEGEAERFDLAVLKSMRTAEDPSNPKGPEWLFLFMRDITALGSGTIIALVMLAVIGYMLLVRQFHNAVLLAVISGGGAALVYLLKLFFARERPVEVPPLIEVTKYSFPSGHAMMGALVYLSLAAILGGIQSDIKVRIYILIVALVTVFLIGFSRVYLGVHYPSDVLAGWSVGLAWASFSRLALLIIQKRGSRT